MMKENWRMRKKQTIAVNGLIEEILAAVLNSDDVGSIKKANETESDDRNINIIETGFPELDKASVVLKPSNLVLIAAKNGMKATSLALSIAKHIAIEQNRRIGIICLKETPEMIAVRLLCNIADVNPTSVMHGWLSTEEFYDIEKAMNALNNASINISTVSINSNKLINATKNLIKQHDVECIVLEASRISARRYMPIMKAMKEVAEIDDIPIMVAMRLPANKKSGKRKRAYIEDTSKWQTILDIAELFMSVYCEDRIHLLKADANYNILAIQEAEMTEMRVKAKIAINKNGSDCEVTTNLAYNHNFERFERYYATND